MEEKKIQRKQIWEFILFVGAMFSGKSSRLISAIERHQIRGSKVLCFKPTIDGRYAEYAVVTHAGGKIEAMPVSSGDQILRIVEKHKPDVVAVDEAFMIDGCADALVEVFQKGVSVYVSSIELSSNLKSFAEVERMMPYATKIEKCAAVCVECGDDARVTHRKVPALEEISIGGADTYEPLCWRCHPLTGNMDVNS
jgi:thymidine kinase